ncbi:MAG: aldo/keto reductase [Brevundimonas sp.]|uniref:aldo/keto reductase n=1 Tax=Brevundimonas sp. TaxID=1871086 RepID=UPI0025BA4DEC|nr:aldo/keto reductase [Brevundimonas sp.]MBX3477149.1 aldo/keto reductase [Brevundimonas sp.]
MRYRPFGRSGAAISNLTLSLGFDALGRGPLEAKELIYSALEAGINAYRLETADPVLAEVVGQALSHIDRKLVCVSLALGRGDGRRGHERDFSAEGMTGAIDRALHVSGLGWFDAALLEEPAEDELPQASLNALKALRSTGRVRLLGVAGEGDVMDTYVSTGAFDVLVTPYHVNSEWRVRHRIRTAREQDMAIFAYGYFPDSLQSARKAAALDGRKRGWFGLGGGGRPKDDPLAGAGTFAFVHQTPNWDAESICLAYALTEPAVSSILISADAPGRIETLAAVTERDMPPGLAAQIEMARINTRAA